MTTWIDWKRCTLALACCFSTGLAFAAPAWDESVQGDFSNDGSSPTLVNLTPGHNSISGMTGNAGQGIDRDYFRFTVPAGAKLDGLWLMPDTFVSGGAAFIAVQAGPRLTVQPSGAGVENLLGYMHYNTDHIGTNLLSTSGLGIGSLSSGTYSVWVQETGGPVSYGFDFVISSVPEPGTSALMLAGLGMVGWLARRRSSH